MTRECISSSEIAPPVGAFSPAVRAGEFVFLSGQVAQSPETGSLIEADVAAHTEQIFENLRALLRAAGKSLEIDLVCR